MTRAVGLVGLSLAIAALMSLVGAHLQDRLVSLMVALAASLVLLPLVARLGAGPGQSRRRGV